MVIGVWENRDMENGDNNIMKKTIVISLVLIFLLCGCSTSSKMNIIAGADEDTQNEFEIKEGIQANVTLSKMASYKVDKSFKTIKLTVEAYQDGKLLETRQILEGALVNTGNEASGFIAMYFTNDGEIKILATKEGEKNEMVMDLENYFENQKFDIASIAMSGLGAEDEKIEVKNGEEYLIAMARVSTDKSEKEVDMHTIQAVTEDIAKLNDIQYALLLKCEFSTESIDGTG